MTAPELSDEERARYSRHLVLPEVGPEGQRKLKAASVLLVGAGGLGSPAALYLAAAGVGTLGVADGDRVEPSNLQRQVLYGSHDVGEPKAAAAARRLTAMNPLVTVRVHDGHLRAANALDVVDDYDVVVDGVDDLATRYVVNDACVRLGKPLVHGSAQGFEGQVSVLHWNGGPCFRCLVPTPPAEASVPTCEGDGVLGVLPGIVGTIQAAEVLKVLLGQGDTLSGRLLLVDALAMTFDEVRIRRDPACATCGSGAAAPEPPARMVEPTSAPPAPLPPISATELHTLLVGGAADLVVLDVREPHEWELCHLEGAQLIPLRELPGRLDEVRRDAEVVVHCHSGVRSAAAVRFLREQGYPRVRNLTGGITAWARDVDPTMPTY